MSIEELMLISAVRYALGRQSYIVGATCEYVASIRGKISDECLRILIRDIEDEIKRYHDIGRTCGMECDEEEWLWLLEVLRGE